VTGTGVAHLRLPLGDGMPTLVGQATWIDGMDVVDAAASSILLNELIAHDEVVDGDSGIGN